MSIRGTTLRAAEARSASRVAGSMKAPLVPSLPSSKWKRGVEGGRRLSDASSAQITWTSSWKRTAECQRRVDRGGDCVGDCVGDRV